MWNPPGPGIEPMSPAFTGKFLFTVSPECPLHSFISSCNFLLPASLGEGECNLERNKSHGERVTLDWFKVTRGKMKGKGSDLHTFYSQEVPHHVVSPCRLASLKEKEHSSESHWNIRQEAFLPDLMGCSWWKLVSVCQQKLTGHWGTRIKWTMELGGVFSPWAGKPWGWGSVWGHTHPLRTQELWEGEDEGQRQEPTPCPEYRWALSSLPSIKCRVGSQLGQGSPCTPSSCCKGVSASGHLHLALCKRGSQSPPGPKYIWDQSHLSVGVGCRRVVSLVPSPPLSSQKVSFPLSTSGILALGNQARVSHGPVWRRNSTQYSLITYMGKEPEE